MIQAILEISVMLLVAAGIGVYFTHRHWKSKYDAVLEDNTQLSSKVEALGQEVEGLGAEVQQLKKKYEDDIEQLKSSYDEQLVKSKADLSAKDKDLKQLKKEKENSENALKKQQKAFEHEIEIKDEALGEKEREIEHLSKEMAHHQVSYYKQIDGKRYKAVTLEKADQSIAGKGDGRISKADATEIFATISDGHQYTQVEKDTMHYLRVNYKWTPEADDLFRTKVRSWAAKGHNLD